MLGVVGIVLLRVEVYGAATTKDAGTCGGVW